MRKIIDNCFNQAIIPMTRTSQLPAAIAVIALFGSIGLANAEDDAAKLFQLQADLDEPRGMCFDIPGFRASIDLNIPLQVHTCKSNPDAREDGLFRLNFPQPGNIYNPEYDVCLDTVETVERASVFMRSCTDSVTQKFDWSVDGQLRPLDTELCLAVSPSPSHPSVLAGTTPEAGVTFVARAMGLAPCADVKDELKQWDLPAPE
jgi:hypothetical protein